MISSVIIFTITFSIAFNRARFFIYKSTFYLVV
jgi:hypothetical protein